MLFLSTKKIYWSFVVSILAFTLTFTACKRENPNIISASGILDLPQIRISSTIGGKIIKIYTDEGKKVSKGNVLFETDCTELKLQLSQAETNLMILQNQFSLIQKGSRKEDIDQVKYSMDILETNLLIAKNDYERAKKLYEANAISKKHLEDAEFKVRIIEKQIEASRLNYQKIKNISQREEIESAKLKVEASKIAVDILKERILNCTVTSPIDGIITKKIFNEGEIVAPGSPVFLLADTSKIYLKVYLQEKDVFKIKINDKAKIKTDVNFNNIIGIVVYISEEAEFTPKTIQTKDERTKLVFMVKLEIENKEGLLKAGLPADAYFEISTK